MPKFSNRDPVYNDIAAPGLQILSILPRPLTARFPACSEQGYSSCGPEEYREAQGTSFATPQVSAAAAVLLSLRPTLRPEQVAAILRSAAVDHDARDRLRGLLPSAATRSRAGAGSTSPRRSPHSPSRCRSRDRYEANDDAGPRSYALFGSTRRIDATVDFWDDQDDVYAIQPQARPARVRRAQGAGDGLRPEPRLLAPGSRGRSRTSSSVRFRVRVSARRGARQYFSYRAPESRHGTSCRCACRAPGSRVTDSTSSRAELRSRPRVPRELLRGTSRSSAAGFPTHDRAIAGRPSSRRLPRRRTPPRRSRPRGRARHRRRRARRA